MSIWDRLGDFIARASLCATTGVAEVVEAVRTLFSGDPELRRRVAFSVAMIALSAKMAKADGVVTQDEVRAFQEIFEVPPAETRNVARLYDLAKGDVAGFETYARQMAQLCGTGHSNCAMLEDILDGLFHIATADGVLHEREGQFLRRVAEIFRIDEAHYETILARHVHLGATDPYAVLGVPRTASSAEIKAVWRKLTREHHPDTMIAKGVPKEYVDRATSRMAAINAAYDRIRAERGED